MTVVPVRVEILPPDESGPCAACPWRLTNHGKPHPDDWYTKANRRRLWSGLRQGEMMTCHPTDPTNPPPTGRPAAGAKPGTATRLCAGAWALLMVEVNAVNAALAGGGHLADYRQGRPHPPLTRAGALAQIERAFMPTGLGGSVVMPLQLTWDPVGTVGTGLSR